MNDSFIAVFSIGWLVGIVTTLIIVGLILWLK